MLKELVLKNRSYRRFYEEHKIKEEELRDLVDLARLAASGRNAQSLRYILINDSAMREEVFKTLAWAGYLTDWVGPEEGERPAAYIIQLNDEELSKNFFCDDGIAAENILLGAVEKGLGGCILRAFKEKELRAILNLPDRFKIVQVLGLGKPKEKVVITEMKGEDIKYWRDEQGVHYVPKRRLEDVILKF
ncbi:MAG: nitroreductase family protein [Marinifilaceae bacterium]